MEDNDEALTLDRDIAELDGIQAAPALAAKGEIVQAQTNALESAAAGWAEIPGAAGVVIGMFLPECKDAFKQEACMEWGMHAAKVAEKHGWNSDGLPPEVALILASLGFALPVGIAIKQRRMKKTDAGGQSNGQALATD